MRNKCPLQTMVATRAWFPNSRVDVTMFFSVCFYDFGEKEKKKKKKTHCPIFLGYFPPAPFLHQSCTGDVMPSQLIPLGRGMGRGDGSSSGTTPWYCINSCFIVIKKKKKHSKDF